VRPLKNLGMTLRDVPIKTKGIPLTFLEALQGLYFGWVASLYPLGKKPAQNASRAVVITSHEEVDREYFGDRSGLEIQPARRLGALAADGLGGLGG